MVKMEHDAVATLAQAELQARKAAEAAARSAAIGAKALFSGLLLSLAGALVGAWLGTRHSRVLTPNHGQEQEFDTHTTTTITHHAHEPAPAIHHTVYEPVAVSPVSMRVYDEPGRTVPSYLRDITFPATKQDLLRVVRANDGEFAVLSKLEQIADRTYHNAHDLMTALPAA